VTVRGPRSAVDALTEDSIKVSVIYRKGAEATPDVVLPNEAVGMKVVSINPQKLRVR